VYVRCSVRLAEKWFGKGIGFQVECVYRQNHGEVRCEYQASQMSEYQIQYCPDLLEQNLEGWCGAGFYLGPLLQSCQFL
jgi:hypothetical protein